MFYGKNGSQTSEYSKNESILKIAKNGHQAKGIGLAKSLPLVKY